MGSVGINFEDSYIVIRDVAKRYADTLANFALDAQANLPEPPANVVSLRYVQADGRIVVSTGDAQREIGAGQWTARFDWAIGAIDSLLVRQAARVPPPTEPPTGSWADRFAALEARVSALEATQ